MCLWEKSMTSPPTGIPPLLGLLQSFPWSSRGEHRAQVCGTFARVYSQMVTRFKSQLLYLHLSLSQFSHPYNRDDNHGITSGVVSRITCDNLSQHQDHGKDSGWLAALIFLS